MSKFIYIAVGGSIGAILRYLVSGFFSKNIESFFPWGTFSVNIIGSFFIGFLWGIFERTDLPSEFRTFIFIGVIASFTTFSTYALESLNMIRSGEYRFALINLFANNIGGLTSVLFGFIAVKYLITLLSRG